KPKKEDHNSYPKKKLMCAKPTKFDIHQGAYTLEHSWARLANHGGNLHQCSSNRYPKNDNKDAT
ncbi:9576_t:CDS:1, partial [Funneliformis mosseae]